MTDIADDSDWKRRDKTKRRYRLKDLPNKHDTGLLANEVPDRERGAGRVLSEMMRTSQANFDHISAELKRFATLYNEGEEDTAYLKEILDPHEHASGAPTHEDVGGIQFWYGNYTAGQDTAGVAGIADLVVPVGVARMVPYWPGKNQYVDRIRIWPSDANGNPNGYTVHLAIYVGDNPGNMPGTLLVNAGDGLCNANPVRLNISQDLTGGTWYWLAAFLSGSGAKPDIVGTSTLEDSGFNAGQSFWWPFHGLDEFVRQQILSYDYPLSAGTFPAFVNTADAMYAQLAPTIELRAA